MSSLIIGLFILGLFSTISIGFAGAPITVDLIAGQTIDAGDVAVWDDGDYLYITIIPDGWVVLESHVAIGQTVDDIPQNNGGPIPGQFAYSDGTSYMIPLSGLGLSGTIVVLVHAVVEVPGSCDESETAWAQADCGVVLQFPGQNWATYITYTL